MKKFRRWTLIVVGITLLAGVVIIGTTQQNFGQSRTSDRLMIERSIETAIATHDAEMKKQIANLQAQIVIIKKNLDEMKELLLMSEEERKSLILKKK